MKDLLPKDEQLTKDVLGNSLLEAHAYWLKKRLIFNIIVGTVGLIATILYSQSLSIFDLMGILMWGLVANGLYSFGYAIESYIITKHPNIKFENIRGLLFWVGTLLYSVSSFLFAYEYYLNIESIT